MKQKKIYLSGKITGLSELKYLHNFKTAKDLLLLGTLAKSCEIVVVNPLEIKPFFGIKKWLFYMINDLRE